MIMGTRQLFVKWHLTIHSSPPTRYLLGLLPAYSPQNIEGKASPGPDVGRLGMNTTVYGQRYLSNKVGERVLAVLRILSVYRYAPRPGASISVSFRV